MRKEVSDLLVSVMNSQWSDFYRRLYKQQHADIVAGNVSQSLWQKLPLLTREHITATQVTQRTFVAPHLLEAVRATNGTSGRSVLLIPRNGGPSMRERFEGFSPRGILTFVNPAHLTEQGVHSVDGLHIPVIAGDPAAPAASIRVAAKVNVDAVTIYPYLLERLLDVFQEQQFATCIRILETFGEHLTRAQRQRYKQIFPNATLRAVFGAVEVSGSPALLLSHAETEIFEGNQGYYFELRKEESGEISDSPNSGEEGELIVTTYAKSAEAFPVIRYRLGDFVRVIRSIEPGRFVFEVLGRIDSDKVKILSGIIWLHEVERALAVSLGSLFSGQYVCVVEIVPDATGVVRERVNVLLPAEVLRDVAQHKSAEWIASELRVSDTRTYAHGVQEGLYMPVTFGVLKDDGSIRKTRRLYRKISL